MQDRATKSKKGCDKKKQQRSGPSGTQEKQGDHLVARGARGQALPKERDPLRKEREQTKGGQERGRRDKSKQKQQQKAAGALDLLAGRKRDGRAHEHAAAARCCGDPLPCAFQRRAKENLLLQIAARTDLIPNHAQNSSHFHAAKEQSRLISAKSVQEMKAASARPARAPPAAGSACGGL